MKCRLFTPSYTIFAILLGLSALPSWSIAQTQNTTTRYQYDLVGNLIQITDPQGRITNYRYDSLNRLTQQLQPALGATRPLIGYTYDGQNRLATVTDPRKLITSYRLDGLGNQSALVSPDTGKTTKDHDAAGNVLTSTDAKGQVTRYQYDALNRVTSISYADGNVTKYTYDQGPNGLGRLTQISDATGTVRYVYDQQGKIINDTRTINNVSYVTAYNYDAGGRLSAITYPNGRAITYTRDGNGHINAVFVKKDGAGADVGKAIVIVNQVTYHPFSDVRSYVTGVGKVIAQSKDLDGRITRYNLGNTTKIINYDAASRIEAISDAGQPANVNRYRYDELDRIAQYSGVGTGQSYSYDQAGNRTSRLLGTDLYSTTINPNSNQITRLSSSATSNNYHHDANGSRTSDATRQYSYDARGRMISASTAQGVVQYKINALGQRVQKIGPGGVTIYHYDSSGQLIGESNVQGVFQKEYIYLTGLLAPIAVIAGTIDQMYYVESDHLNTPRVISDAKNNVVWEWKNTDPFGNNLPVASDGFEFNLRFPGQYFDKETNLHYNYYRDYDPSTGRYLQSDPIGLVGGVNTYAYVSNQPTRYIDPLGLNPVGGAITGAEIGSVFGPVGTVVGGAVGAGIGAWVGWNVVGPIFAKPPENAYDPNGPKAPGKPGDAEGFCDSKGGENWVRNPNGRGFGWEHKDGSVWVPTGPDSKSTGNAHGGAHWDVQFPGGGYQNVKPVR